MKSNELEWICICLTMFFLLLGYLVWCFFKAGDVGLFWLIVSEIILGIAALICIAIVNINKDDLNVRFE